MPAGVDVAAAADAAALVILASVTPEVRAAMVRAVAKMIGASAAPVAPLAWENLPGRGRLRYLPGFSDLWLGTEPYDLRGRTKARLCIQYLFEQEAFDAASARHLVDEIDPYVRKAGDFPRAADIQILFYFNDRRGKLSKLYQDLIRSAGRDGRYFLKVD